MFFNVITLTTHTRSNFFSHTYFLLHFIFNAFLRLSEIKVIKKEKALHNKDQSNEIIFQAFILNNKGKSQKEVSHLAPQK